MPDSRRIFVFTEGQGRYLDVATGDVVAKVPVDLTGQWDPRLSPDGLRLLTHQPGKAILWDAQNGRRLAVLPAQFYMVGYKFSGRGWIQFSMIGDRPLDQDSVSSIEPNAVFSPDGRRIVAPSGRTAVLWDGFTGEQLALLHGHESHVYGAVFSPDNRWVATCADDGVRIWYADSGKEFFQPTNQRAWRVAFSPDSRWIVTNNGFLYPVDPLATARERKHRELTPIERERFEIGVVEPTACIDALSPKQILHRERGNFQAQGGDWKAASASFLQALEWDPDDLQSLSGAAVTLLASGDRVGYTQLCQTHARRLKPIATRYEWYWIARICSLVPGVPDDLLKMVMEPVEAHSAKADSDLLALDRIRYSALGTLCYRAGRYEEAIKWLDRADELGGRFEPQISFFQAMAHHHLGQAAKARSNLAEGSLRMERLQQKLWSVRLESQWLREEAEALMGNAPRE
jgi:tetratricopeptide (TPR) repeat protein